MAVVEREERVSDRPADSAWRVANIIYVLFGILEALLAFRFVFRLLGANPGSSFVHFIYGITDPFVAPFYGIFNQPTINYGAAASAVFDSSTLVAMAVYALVAWALVRLFAAFSRPR